MKMRVRHPSKKIRTEITLPSSKSISNRALILQALFPDLVRVTNISTADDSRIMRQALSVKEGIIQVKNAGTCMRFLTAYFASVNSDVELRGDARMNKRPIGILADSLIRLGADITYMGEAGFPPLRIRGRKMQ